MIAFLTGQFLSSPDNIQLIQKSAKGLVCFYLSKYLAAFTLVRRKKKDLEAAQVFQLINQGK